MARPDPRLLELTAVLTEAGLDWLALELLQGIRDGVRAEERPDDLETARVAVRLGKQPEPDVRFPESALQAPKQLEGDEQVDWAVAYAFDRLTDATSMLHTSLSQLNRVAASKESLSLGGDEAGWRSGIDLQVGEQGPVVATMDIERVRADLATLRDALHVWARDSRR